MAAVAVGISVPSAWDTLARPSEDAVEERPNIAITRGFSHASSCGVIAGLARRPHSGGLEAWLADETQWQQARLEDIPRHAKPYRVCVPSGFPGVQYRRSKSLTDRYRRYAPAGSVVHGCEEESSWLRVAKSVYVPIVVDGRRVMEPFAEVPDSLNVSCNCADPSSSSSPLSSAALKAELLAAVHPSTRSNWLCATVPGSCNTNKCDVAPCVGVIEVVGTQREFDSATLCLDDEADASPLSARSMQPSLPALPRCAPPSLPTRAPSGDHAVDEAERLLARVIDPFGAME